VKEIDYDALRRLIAHWRNTNANYYGDYYPLTPYSRADNVWIAWQLHRPEVGAGMVQAFRRADCPAATIRLKLRGLKPDTRYDFKQLDGPNEFSATGADLLSERFSVSTSQSPAAVIYTYSIQK
jgi:alpha-galactosidase